MHDFPHRYAVQASAEPETHVRLASSGLANIESAAPVEFDGPGGLWSPETLLAAAVADCFVLSFKAIATASRFEWLSLTCDVDAVLDRVEKTLRFTEIHEDVVLRIPSGGNEAIALRLLEKAERHCLITNSLNAQTHLKADVQIVE